MDYTGKKVTHKTYGTGTVTALYNERKTIWVQFSEQSPKPYKIADDFDSGLLSTYDQDLLDYIADFKKTPLFRAKALWGKKTPNKDINKVYRECCEILDDCGIKYGKVIGLTIATDSAYVNKRFGRCTNRTDGFVIEIAKELLDDSAYDTDLYTVIIHELIHTCDGGLRHNKAWYDYIKIVRKRYGFTLQRTADSGMAMRYTPYFRCLPLNGGPEIRECLSGRAA